MQHYPKAARGIQLLFLSIVLSIIAPPLTILGIGLIVSVVSIVLQLVALFIASQDDSGYRNAFLASIVNLALNLVCSNFLQQGSTLYTAVSSVSSLIGLYMTYQVITVTVRLLLDKAPSVAAQGQGVAKLYVTCFAINFVCSFAEQAPVIGEYAHVISIFASLVQLVGYVMFLVFLFRAGRSLK